LLGLCARRADPRRPSWRARSLHRLHSRVPHRHRLAVPRDNLRPGFLSSWQLAAAVLVILLVIAASGIPCWSGVHSRIGGQWLIANTARFTSSMFMRPSGSKGHGISIAARWQKYFNMSCSLGSFTVGGRLMVSARSSSSRSSSRWWGLLEVDVPDVTIETSSSKESGQTLLSGPELDNRGQIPKSCGPHRDERDDRRPGPSCRCPLVRPRWANPHGGVIAFVPTTSLSSARMVATIFPNGLCHGSIRVLGARYPGVRVPQSHPVPDRKLSRAAHAPAPRFRVRRS